MRARATTPVPITLVISLRGSAIRSRRANGTALAPTEPSFEPSLYPTGVWSRDREPCRRDEGPALSGPSRRSPQGARTTPETAGEDARVRVPFSE